MNSNSLEHLKGNIYLCGFMASGKSTLGRKIAQKLGLEFRDLDAVIVAQTGQTINEIFLEKGEPHFRQKEWEYMQHLNRDFRGVVSLGGGALHNQQVIDYLKTDGLLIFLDTPMDEILKRVHRNTRRPVLYDKDGKKKSKETLFTELKALYLQREAFYKQAQIIIKSASYSSVEKKADATIEQIIRHV